MKCNVTTCTDSRQQTVIRSAIAEAAEAAVCETLGTSLYACLLLSTIGGSLAQQAFGRPYHLIVGSLQILTGDVEPVTGEAAGVEMNTGDGQSFHALFGCQHADGTWELADLSARHYKTYAESVTGTAWKVEVPPAYIWGYWPNAFPDYVRFIPDQDATQRQIEKLRGSEEVKDLVENAIQKYLNFNPKNLKKEVQHL